MEFNKIDKLMDIDTIISKLQGTEPVQFTHLPEHDMSGYNDNKEEYEELKKTLTEDKIKKRMGRRYFKYESGLKTRKYLMRRLYELKGIAAIKSSLANKDVEAFKDYKIVAYIRKPLRVKDQETGVFKFILKTDYLDRGNSYILTYVNGISTNIKDDVHASLIKQTKDVIEKHPLEISEIDHMTAVSIPHPDFDGNYVLEYRITIERFIKNK